MPARVATAHKRSATLLARGTAVSKRAGKLTIVLKATKAGRSALRRSRAVKVAVVTVLRDSAGNERKLAVKRLTLRR